MVCGTLAQGMRSPLALRGPEYRTPATARTLNVVTIFYAGVIKAEDLPNCILVFDFIRVIRAIRG